MRNDDSKWKEPVLGDAVLTGVSAVFSEADLCDQAACKPEALEDWLGRDWCEHDIHAVMEGREELGPRSMLLKRSTGFKKKVLGEAMGHVLWRLFSPSATALGEWTPEQVSRYCSVRPQPVSSPAPAKSARAPRRFCESELKRCGVTLLDESSTQLQCVACSQVWSPNLLSGGKLPRGYWKCPSGCNTSHQAPRAGGPVEIDLEDPAAAAWMGERSIEAFISFEEQYLGDPGQRSGASLRLMEAAEGVFLNAEIASTHHCLGYVQPAAAAQFAIAIAGGESPVEASLQEIYPEISPARPSGAKLFFFAGRYPQLRLQLGPHCAGVLRGALLTKFLECLRVRCAPEPACV